MKVKVLELEVNAEELNVDRSLKAAFADLADSIAETFIGKRIDEDDDEDNDEENSCEDEE